VKGRELGGTVFLLGVHRLPGLEQELDLGKAEDVPALELVDNEQRTCCSMTGAAAVRRGMNDRNGTMRAAGTSEIMSGMASLAPNTGEVGHRAGAGETAKVSNSKRTPISHAQGVWLQV